VGWLAENAATTVVVASCNRVSIPWALGQLQHIFHLPISGERRATEGEEPMAGGQLHCCFD